MSNRTWIILLAALFIMLLAAPPAFAQAPAAEPGPFIHLARGAFDPLQNKPAWEAQAPAALRNLPQSDVYILQFSGPVQESWKASVRAAGVRLLSYLPDHAYIVRLEGISAAAVRSLEHVRWIGPYEPIYKIEPSLDAEIETGATLTLMVRLFPGEARPAAEKALIALGGQLEEAVSSDLLGDAFKIALPAHRIPAVAALPAISWIEPALPMQLAHERARSIMQVNATWAAMAGRGINLYGAGQIVAVADTGFDTGNTSTLNLDLRDRFIKAYMWGGRGVWDDPHGHGTHVAGSVLGSGRNSGSNPTTRQYATSFAGVAPEASLIFQSLLTTVEGGLSTPADLKLLFGPPHTDGARIHTNSWGHPTGGSSPNYTYGAYDTASATADEFMWLNPTSLLLFAAGNSGVDANADGVIDLDQIMSPGTAKNVLTVGATENNRPPSSGFGGYSGFTWSVGAWSQRFPVNPIKDDYISNNVNGLAAFSSRGPTDDGRVKPEIVAPGTDIISIRSSHPSAGTGWGVHNQYYIYNGGTSMATPLTAGAATLVRQFYTTVQRLSNPSAALIKATLLNGAQNISPGQYGSGSAREIPATTPNNVIGFGRVDLMNTLALTSPLRLLYWDVPSGLTTNSIVTYSVYITQTGVADSRLTVTLCWTDFPASPGVGKTLVNDLDLEVVGPTGMRYLGNGKVVWDRLNNTEQVVIAAPAQGAYQLVLRGAAIPQGQQPYALVVAGPYLSPSPPDSSKWLWLPLSLRQFNANPVATRTPTPTASRSPTPTPTRTPTATPTRRPGPQAGFWRTEGGEIEFYVTADQAFVKDFAVYISVEGCGDYRIVHSQLEPIILNAFSFSGNFSASGTFFSVVTASGSAGLNNYYIAGCGFVSGGPWPYNASYRPPFPAPPQEAPPVATPATSPRSLPVRRVNH